MLTGYQCETIAFVGDGEFVCVDCAVEQHGALTVAKAERGLSNGGGLSPMSRYSVDEQQDYEAQSLWDSISQDGEQAVFDWLAEHGVPDDRLEELDAVRHIDSEFSDLASTLFWDHCSDTAEVHCGGCNEVIS